MSLFPANEPHAPAKNFAVTWLPSLTTPEKLTLPPHRTAPPVLPPKLKLPQVPELKSVPVVKQAVPETPRPVSTLPVVQSALARPLNVPANPTPIKQVAVRTGLFGGAASPVTTRRPVEAVQTGGFGSPQGVPGLAQSESAGTVAKLGSFALPEGEGKGNGTGGTRGVQGVVASAGFGSGVAGSGTGNAGKGTGDAGDRTGKQGVSVGGFTKAVPVTPTARESAQAVQAADFQPVEILSKPDPLYTEEARRLGVQGEVKLSVVFQASGVIHVMGVVKSLGHGLDQAAEQAASRIRFKPAQREGKPVDFPATLRIEFRLAGQSS